MELEVFTHGIGGNWYMYNHTTAHLSLDGKQTLCKRVIKGRDWFIDGGVPVELFEDKKDSDENNRTCKQCANALDRISETQP